MSENNNSLTITSTHAGKRLDMYLAEKLSLSRTLIKKAILRDKVLVNGKSCKAHYFLKSNDVIALPLFEEEPEHGIRPIDLNLSILYEDEDILVLDKPAGLPVHPGAGNKTKTLVNGLVYYTPHLSLLPGRERPGIVHRLDKDTTGCLIIAKTDEAYLNLKKQFQDRLVDKTYIAIVFGEIKRKYMKIDMPIKRHPVNRIKMHTSRDEEGRKSVTEITLRESACGFSLVEAKILTGRTHQIRVHLSAKGFPVAGDKIYNLGRKVPENMTPPSRQMLHAWKIEFIHPIKCNKIFIESKWPRDIEKTWNDINLLHMK